MYKKGVEFEVNFLKSFWLQNHLQQNSNLQIINNVKNSIYAASMQYSHSEIRCQKC